MNVIEVDGEVEVITVGVQGPQGPNAVSDTTATALTGYLKGDGETISASATVPATDLTGSGLPTTNPGILGRLWCNPADGILRVSQG